jgi:hypothetical protein
MLGKYGTQKMSSQPKPPQQKHHTANMRQQNHDSEKQHIQPAAKHALFEAC